VRLVEAVGDRRTARAGFVPIGVEHKVVDEELRAPSEQVDERGFAAFDVKGVFLVEAHPGQLPPLTGQLVVQAGQLLFGLQQIQPGSEPLVTVCGAMVRHWAPP
jgi:hypothetical protein